METIYVIKNNKNEVIASNLPSNYTFDKSEIINKIKTIQCPISGKKMRHGFFETENGNIYLASYTAETNKIFKRYFEACDYFIPSLTKSLELQKTKTKYNFRRFKHNLVTHHTKIHQELEFAFSVDNSDKGIHNQIDYIQNILQTDTKQSAISILKIIKSSNLMKSEFDVYDMLSSENPTLELFYHSPRKLIHLVISPFWLELIEKGIKINIGECNERVNVDYRYISVVLSHIFENTSKYILKNSTLDIYFTDKRKEIEISFEMMSLKIEESEKEKIFSENFSGHYAKSITLAGSGIGLNLVKKLVEINNGNVSVEINISPTENEKLMGIPYEKNKFNITLPK